MTKYYIVIGCDRRVESIAAFNHPICESELVKAIQIMLEAPDVRFVSVEEFPLLTGDKVWSIAENSVVAI